MWSCEMAKSLIEKGEKAEDQLTKELAIYLGFALDTIDYYEKIQKTGGK